MSVRTTMNGIAVAVCAILFLQLARADDTVLYKDRNPALEHPVM